MPVVRRDTVTGIHDPAFNQWAIPLCLHYGSFGPPHSDRMAIACWVLRLGGFVRLNGIRGGKALMAESFLLWPTTVDRRSMVILSPSSFFCQS